MLYKQLTAFQAEDILNRKAGWTSMTGSANFKDIVQKANLTHPPHEHENNPFNLAFHLFVDRVLDFVGAFHLKLGANVDALVFAGGVGERSQELRHVVGNAVECLQYQPIDQEKNSNVHFDDTVKVVEIGAGGTEKGRVLVCQTDEQVGIFQINRRDAANARTSSRWLENVSLTWNCGR